ncbi:hypothetical protein GOBAR_DD35892 [Gossypium barbadense]|nr:hypothetical protein GOBAR_DD35892 [Gossypium barbadense]
MSNFRAPLGYSSSKLNRVVLLFAMEWNSKSLKGLNPYEKTIGVLFQSVNTRQAGETVVNLPAMSTVILVVITVIM